MDKPLIQTVIRNHYQSISNGNNYSGLDDNLQPSSDINYDRNNMELYYKASEDENPPWWRSNLAVSSPVLFGTWDGVFTSCMVNIFGVVIFLRTGWIVGNAGLESSIAIIILTESVSVVTVLSAVGISQNSDVIWTGGVYTLMSHVLGSKIATPVSLLYCFGQAISCSLCVLAFGESILDLLSWKNVWISRLIACGALIFILGVLALGITWLIGLQILLIALLFVAILDFLLGSFITYDLSKGVTGYNRETFLNNTGLGYSEGENFFSVLGVYFPMSCGVLAGFNMITDVKDPPNDIPKGSLAAIFVSSAIYLMFSFILSATCTRDTLRIDYMIAEKVSATQVLWLIGLYQLSLSSAVGNLCGCPQALVGIAADEVFTVLNPLAKGIGPNKVPFIATSALAVVSLVFVLVGQLNSLSVITTVLYLITYALVNYSYFILYMSIKQNDPLNYERMLDELESNKTCSKDRKQTQTLPDKLKDQGSSGAGQIDQTPPLQHSKSETIISIDCSALDDQSDNKIDKGVRSSDPKAQELFDVSDEFSVAEKDKLSSSQESTTSAFQCPVNWAFAYLCHPLISLIGAIVCILSSFMIDWIFTLLSIFCVLFIWFIIGIVNPGVPTGIAKFSYRKWTKDCARKLCMSEPSHQKQIILIKPIPKLEMKVTRQSIRNMDIPRKGNFRKDKFHEEEWSMSDSDRDS